MAVRKIHNRWYVDVRYNGKRIRKVSKGNTKRAALIQEQEILQNLKREEEHKHTGGKTYANYKEFSYDWFTTYVITNNRPSEQRRKQSILKHHILPYFGEMKIDEIFERDIELFKATKQKHYAPKTINNMLTVLRKSLDSANEWRLLPYVPKVKWLKAPRKKIEIVSRQACAQLLSDKSDPPCNALVVTALKTGMRQGEMLALRWRDIDLDENTININASMNVYHDRAPTKNGRIRIVPMSYDVRSHMLSLTPPKDRHPDRYVFYNGNGKPYRARQLDTMLKNLKKRLGIKEHLYWHKFRHTFASNLARRGVNMRILQELMGHSTILMTEKYSHVDMSAKHSAIQLLDYSNENFGPKVGRFHYTENRVQKNKAIETALFSRE